MAFTLMILSSCEDDDNDPCKGQWSEEVMPYPKTYENFFLDLPKPYSNTNWKNNRGLSENYSSVSQVNSWRGFNKPNWNEESCKQYFGLCRYAFYTASNYGQNFKASLTLRDNDAMLLEVTMHYNDTVFLYPRMEKTFSAIINRPDQFNENFDILDSIKLNNHMYFNIYCFKNPDALSNGGKFSMIELYIDRYKGPIGYLLKDGEVWNQE